METIGDYKGVRVMKTIFLFAAALAICLLNSGCTATGSYTSMQHFTDTIIGPIEQRGISYQGVYRNPVIVLHGFLGANLKNRRTGENIWGQFRGIDGFTVRDERMLSLALPMEMSKPLNDLVDDTVPDGILEMVIVRVLGFTFSQNAYRSLIDVLESGGFQPEGRPMGPGKNYNTLFEFAYDWRRDLQWNAVKLHEFIVEKRKYLQQQFEIMYGVKDYDVQFDLIGHSMGGLLSGYYLKFGSAELPEENEPVNVTWKGSEYVDRLVMLGTPNAGYLDTLLELQRGSEVPPFPPALLATWPTYYQMLPAPSKRSVYVAGEPDNTVDLFDIRNWLKYKWGLADPGQAEVLRKLLPHIDEDTERRRIAFDHLEKCLLRARRFIRAMAEPSEPPPDVKLYLFLGSAAKTRVLAEVDPASGRLQVSDFGPGDGKVSSSSALYDLRAGGTWTPFFRSPIRWDGIVQLRSAHMGITTDPAFKDNILFLLSAVPSPRHQQQLRDSGH